MDEMDARAECTHHGGQVVVGARAERAGAQRQPDRRARHGVEEVPDIVGRRPDARQAEQRPGRIVRMAAQPHAVLLGDRGDGRQEIDMVRAQPPGVDAAIVGEPCPHIVERPVLGGARQAGGDVGRQFGPAVRPHGRKAAGRRVDHRLGVIVARVRPPQNVQIEDGEIDQVEDHRPAAAFGRRAQIGPRPVEDRHEIVADRFDAAGGEVGEAFGIARNVAAPVAAPRLDGLGNGQALDHLPGKARRRAVRVGRDLALALFDCGDRPDGAGRKLVQRRHDRLGAGLARVGDRNTVDRPEPAPCLPHIALPIGPILVYQYGSSNGQPRPEMKSWRR